MHLTHLSLANVRTFRRLELDLEPGRYVIAGDNAQGKTNLLESIALLATTRSSRTSTDLDLVRWQAIEEEPLPAARYVADVQSREGRTTLEVAISVRDPVPGVPPTAAQRRFRVNGVARRASDLIGRLRVVMFSADDLTIIDGSPGNRRRYLDITLSQLDQAYVRALQRYTRVLQQRNSLLRRLQERSRRDPGGELDFWDEELAKAGAVILAGRAGAVRRLATDAAARYAELTATDEALGLCYQPAVPDELAAALAERDQRADDLEPRFLAALEAGRRDDVIRGVTRIGPHRDDVLFTLDGHPAAVAASRGQQRTAALALRLAEVALSTSRTGEPPVLLLDDILSELDPHRRERVLAVATGVDQVLITTPDADRPSAAELPDARRFTLDGGVLTPV